MMFDVEGIFLKRRRVGFIYIYIYYIHIYTCIYRYTFVYINIYYQHHKSRDDWEQSPKYLPKIPQFDGPISSSRDEHVIVTKRKHDMAGGLGDDKGMDGFAMCVAELTYARPGVSVEYQHAPIGSSYQDMRTMVRVQTRHCGELMPRWRPAVKGSCLTRGRRANELSTTWHVDLSRKGGLVLLGKGRTNSHSSNNNDRSRRRQKF